MIKNTRKTYKLI